VQRAFNSANFCLAPHQTTFGALYQDPCTILIESSPWPLSLKPTYQLNEQDLPDWLKYLKDLRRMKILREGRLIQLHHFDQRTVQRPQLEEV